MKRFSAIKLYNGLSSVCWCVFDEIDKRTIARCLRHADAVLIVELLNKETTEVCCE